MDLKEIRSELHKLSELVDGWQDLSGVAALERDWALEKLRAIYEVLRFGTGQTAAAAAAPAVVATPATTETAPTPAAEKSEVAQASAEDTHSNRVDSDEVLSVETVEEPAEIEPIAPGAVELSVERPVHEGTPAAPAVGPQGGIEADPALEVIDLVDEPEEMPETVPAAAPVREAVESDEPYAGLEIASASVRQDVDAEAQYADDAAQIAEAQPVPGEASDQELPEPEAPTLFGPDDKKESHRRKQRVIMSLYDTAPGEEMPEHAGESAARQHPTPVDRRKAAAGAESEIVLLDAYTEEPVEESRSERAGRSIEVPAQSPVADPGVPVAETYDPVEPQGDPEQVPLDIEVLQEDFAAPAGAVLGEVINHDVQTLADTIAAPGFGRYGEPISDLRQAIGINDKFLMIRDLFGGDSALFETTIAALNAQPGLDDCMIYIAEHFAWNPDSESARLMMELLERKFA